MISPADHSRSLPRSPSRYWLLANGFLLIFILVVEKFAVGAHIYQLIEDSNSSYLATLLLENGKAISRTLILTPIIFLILIHESLPGLRTLYRLSYTPALFYFLPLQVFSFLLFYFFAGMALNAHSHALAYQSVWLSIGVCWGVSTALSLAPPTFWRQALTAKILPLFGALAISSVIWQLGTATQDLWQYLSNLTFVGVETVLRWISRDVYTSYSERIIGIPSFLVNIDTQCSGYEGIGLVTAFISVFLFSFRRDFRFPRALILFPVGAMVIWLFNILRIVALILIGHFWSPDVAIWGFHTQAGWIAFILTAVAIMWLAHSSRFFSYRPSASTSDLKAVNLPIATLLPLVALLAATFLSRALSGQVDWWYPLRVVAVIGAIAYCLRYLDVFPLRWHYIPILAGIAVAPVWILLADVDTDVDALYRSAFSQSESILVLLWLLSRFMGAVITVPIAEELGFRAYLLCRLSSQPVLTRGHIRFSILAFVVSSVAFGLLHDAWLAGTLAGMIYALVRIRSTHIFDAIVAHSVTNLLLFGFVILTGHWSLL